MELTVARFAHSHGIRHDVRSALRERDDVMNLEEQRTRVDLIPQSLARFASARCVLPNPRDDRRISIVD
jgi:hypothetical protein